VDWPARALVSVRRRRRGNSRDSGRWSGGTDGRPLLPAMRGARVRRQQTQPTPVRLSWTS